MTALTASAIVTAGYRDAQKLGRGAALPADLLNEGIDRLNDIINLWVTQGLKLFLESEEVTPLVAGKQMYTFLPGATLDGTRRLRVKEMNYWDEDNNNRPLIPISRQEWSDLSNRTAQGSVNQYFVEKLHDRLNVYVWQIPDTVAARGSLHIVFHKQCQSVSATTPAILFPSEWAIALRWAIADEVSFGMPAEVQARCQQRAQAYRQALEDWDVEDAETFFQIDTRATYYSKFR